jgi:hypothetical protein
MVSQLEAVMLATVSARRTCQCVTMAWLQATAEKEPPVNGRTRKRAEGVQTEDGPHMSSRPKPALCASPAQNGPNPL